MYVVLEYVIVTFDHWGVCNQSDVLRDNKSSYSSLTDNNYTILLLTLAAVNTPAPSENNVEVNQPNVSGGVYVPPSLRKQKQTNKTKKVPDITSQQAFPSLQPSAALNKDSRYFVGKDFVK